VSLTTRDEAVVVIISASLSTLMSDINRAWYCCTIFVRTRPALWRHWSAVQCAWHLRCFTYTRLHVTDKAFSIAGPRAWNALPSDMKLISPQLLVLPQSTVHCTDRPTDGRTGRQLG